MSWTLTVQLTTCSGAEQSSFISSHWKHWIWKASPGAAQRKTHQSTETAPRPSVNGQRAHSSGALLRDRPDLLVLEGPARSTRRSSVLGGKIKNKSSFGSSVDDRTAPGGPWGLSRTTWALQESPGSPGKQRAQKEEKRTRRLLGPTTEESLQTWIQNKTETRSWGSWGSRIKADASDDNGSLVTRRK